MTDIAEHHRRLVELERADARRAALERGALEIDNLSGRYRSEIYRKALKAAAKALRDMIGKG